VWHERHTWCHCGTYATPLEYPRPVPAAHLRSSRPRQVEITATDGYAHRVSDDSHAWGVQAGQGAYWALCGNLVLADSLASPARPLCPGCRARSA
jgi:hypothetical protein